MWTCLVSWNASSPSCPSSRPRPDCFIPPNGPASLSVSGSLNQIVPGSRRPADLHPRRPARRRSAAASRSPCSRRQALEPVLDLDLSLEGAVHRALRRDRDQAPGLIVGKLRRQPDREVEPGSPLARRELVVDLDLDALQL